MEKQIWTREKVKEVLQELSKLPDFDYLPLPDNIGKEFNIPITPAKALSFREYVKEFKNTQENLLRPELRPSDGILREVKGEEPPQLIICPTSEVEKYLKSQTADETPELPSQTMDTPTESNGSEPLPYLDVSNSLPSQNDDSNISLSV